MAGSTSTYSLPYPEPTDLVADYPALGQDLAEDLDTILAAKAPLASPTFTGTVTIPGVDLDAWTAYTPTLTASTTNPTLGSGATQTGYYVQIGKLVSFYAKIIFGSGASAGSGTYRVSLPVSAVRAIDQVAGNVQLTDISTTNVYQAVASMANTGFVQMYRTAGSYGVVTNSAPFTWGDSDQIFVSGTYEVA